MNRRLKGKELESNIFDIIKDAKKCQHEKLKVATCKDTNGDKYIVMTEKQFNLIIGILQGESK